MPDLIRTGSCLDGESGLYTLTHFWSVLEQEMARLDRWSRPLSLVLLEKPADQGGWAAFGRLLLASLRPIDLAARLAPSRAAVILPDANSVRARRWFADLSAELEQAGLAPSAWALALALPRAGREAGEMLAQAEKLLSRDFSPEGDCLEDDRPEDDFEEAIATAIAADERNLLFDGFKALTNYKS
ncbi:MAG: hypothetical protein LBP55_10215 [Candidatus Adiutrix sp.]|nr:hypothetical protein [Candidatus Adiutrix sp.]